MECFPEHALEAWGPLAADLALSRPPTLKESKKIQRAYLLLVNHIYVTSYGLVRFGVPKKNPLLLLLNHMTTCLRECANLKVQLENPTLKKNILEERGVLCAHHCVNCLLVGGNPWELVLKPPVCSTKLLSLNLVLFMFYNSQIEMTKCDRTQPAVCEQQFGPL